MHNPEMQSVKQHTLDQSTVNIRPDLGNAEHASREETLHPSSIHPEQAAAEPGDAGVERSKLFAADVPPPWTYARTKDQQIEAIENFNGRILSMAEGEYGDWMRRANMYWWHLVEALHGLNDKGVKRVLAEMHRLIQYNPDYNITATARKVVALSQRIERYLGENVSIDDVAVSVADQGQSQAPDYSLMVADRKEANIEPLLEGGSNQGFIGKG